VEKTDPLKNFRIKKLIHEKFKAKKLKHKNWNNENFSSDEKMMLVKNTKNSFIAKFQISQNLFMTKIQKRKKSKREKFETIKNDKLKKFVAASKKSKKIHNCNNFSIVAKICLN
jgi:hypothetical protein